MQNRGETQAIDLTPRQLQPLYIPACGTTEFHHTEEGIHILPTHATGQKFLRTPLIHYYDPAQTEALVMMADEISFNITHLNIGRDTVKRYGHVGAVLKKDGKTIAHLDGIPGELAMQPDGQEQWVPVGMGMHYHQIKLFCMTPESIAERTEINGDPEVFADIGSINLAELSHERRALVASRIRWAMEEINEAEIPYIVPGSTISIEAAHILAARQGWLTRPLARAVLATAAKVKRIEDNVSDVIDLASQRLERLLAGPASAQSGHRIVPDEEAAIHGANSKDVLLALADILERREDVDDMLARFLAQPDKADFMLPGGNSDLLRQTLWRFAPKVWKDIAAEAEAIRRERHNEAIRNMGRIAATGAFIAFMMQGGTAVALEGVKIAHSKATSSGDPIAAFKQASSAAAAAASMAVEAVQDPAGALQAAGQVARNPWQALGDIQVPGTYATLGVLLLVTFTRPKSTPAEAVPAQPQAV